MRRAPVVIGLLALFFHALVGSASAQGGRDEEARALFQAAQMAFTDGRYEDALDYFEKSYQLSGRAALLFNIGTTADRLRLEEKALAAFRQYLVDLPEADNRREVESRIRIIERALADRPAESAQPEATDAAPDDEPTFELQSQASAADSGKPEKKPLVKKWWFWTIIGVAAVGLLGAGAVASSGSGDSYKGLETGDDGRVIFTLGFGN